LSLNFLNFLPNSFSTNRSPTGNLKHDAEEKYQPNQHQKMQNIIPMIINILTQKFVVNFNFSANQHRIRVQIHHTNIENHLSKSLAIKQPKISVNFSSVFHQSQNQLFSEDNQNRAHHTQQKINPEPNMQSRLVVFL
jgi:hypothetical protein